MPNPRCAPPEHSADADEDQGVLPCDEDRQGQTLYAFALWNLVIRPPRASYDPAHLGPSDFLVYGVRAKRRDLQLTSPRGHKIVCTHFSPVLLPGRPDEEVPVVIYLHGNSSSRLEACGVAKALLARRIALFCYDASGCGLSEGEYVSLGWHERDDLAMIIEHLRESPNCGAIGLWGRSMGAVTSLLHADRDPSIGAMCLDSPFASLRQLIWELAQSEYVAIKVPTWLLSMVLQFVRLRISTLAGFDIEDLVPTEHVKDSFTPALFLHGREDTFILPKHSKQLHDEYAGDKEYLAFTGDHNSERGQDIVERVVTFFCRAFRHDIFAPHESPQPQADTSPPTPPSPLTPPLAPAVPLKLSTATVPVQPGGDPHPVSAASQARTDETLQQAAARLAKLMDHSATAPGVKEGSVPPLPPRDTSRRPSSDSPSDVDAADKSADSTQTGAGQALDDLAARIRAAAAPNRGTSSRARRGNRGSTSSRNSSWEADLLRERANGAARDLRRCERTCM